MRQSKGIKNLDFRKSTPKDNTMADNYFLLGIGIDLYESPKIDNLKSCKQDIEDVFDLLSEHYNFSLNTEYAKTLFNKEATLDNILNGLDWLIERTAQEQGKINDIIIYYSGHSYQIQGGRSFWQPYDAKVPDEDKHYRTYIDYEEIRFKLNELTKNTRNILLINDTCYAGKIVNTDKITYYQGNIEEHRRCRYALCSSIQKNKAYDGTFGKVLKTLLEKHAYDNFDFSIIAKKVMIESGLDPKNAQITFFHPLGLDEKGLGEFTIYVKKKLPEPKLLFDKLLDLNFKKQRRMHEDSISDKTKRIWVLVGSKKAGHDMFIRSVNRNFFLGQDIYGITIEISNKESSFNSNINESNIWISLSSCLLKQSSNKEFSHHEIGQKVFNLLKERNIIILFYLFESKWERPLLQFWASLVNKLQGLEKENGLHLNHLHCFIYDMTISETENTKPFAPKWNDVATEFEKIDGAHAMIYPEFEKLSNDQWVVWANRFYGGDGFLFESIHKLDGQKYLDHHMVDVVTGICKDLGFDGNHPFNPSIQLFLPIYKHSL